MRDEVNEPLGVLPAPERRSAAWMTPAVAAPAAVAVAMAAFTLGGHNARPPGGSIAVQAQPAPVRAEPPPPAQSATVAAPIVPPIATADRVEAASGVKVTRNGAAGAPTPLIIDVQQALAAERARAATAVAR